MSQEKNYKLGDKLIMIWVVLLVSMTIYPLAAFVLHVSYGSIWPFYIELIFMISWLSLTVILFFLDLLPYNSGNDLDLIGEWD